MSRLHSEALLAKANTDAASLSISQTTSSDGTTVYGIGATSGRAILAVGKFTLRGIEKGVIVWKLLSIQNRLRSKKEVKLRVVKDLLELQRIKLYPKPITRCAWSLIGVLLERGQVRHFMAVLSEWSPLETQLFLRQLVAYRFSGWDKHQDIRRFMAVTSSVRTIVLSFLDKDPLFLQGIFDASDFATFLIPGVHHGHTVEFSLSSFFRHLCANYEGEGKRTGIIKDMVNYLRTEGPTQMLPVVDHIIKMISSMVSDHEIQTSRARLRHNVSGALPYLSFALQLATASDVAASLFVEREAFQIIEEFCMFGFPNASCYHYQNTVNGNVHVRWMAYATCCALLARLYPATDWSTTIDHTYNAVLFDLFLPIMPLGDLGAPFYEDVDVSNCLENARLWNFILHSMSSCEDISFLSSMLRHTSNDLAVRFLRDLGAYKNYGWCRNAGILSALTDYYAFYQETLDSRLHSLIRDLAVDKSHLLIEAYGMAGFTRLLVESDYLKHQGTRNIPSSSLSLFMKYLTYRCQQTNEWEPPDTILPLLELVKNVDPSITQPLLDRVLDGLRFFTGDKAKMNSFLRLSDDSVCLQSDSYSPFHPAHPFLMLTHQLCLTSPTVAARLCKSGLVAILEDMWSSKCGQTDKAYTNDGHGAWLHVHVGIVLTASALMSTQECEEYILRSLFPHWFLTDDVHVNTLRRYANDENVQCLLLRSMQSTLLYRKDACAGVWKALIGVPLRRDGCYQKGNIGICLEDRIACFVVALSCLPEHRWKGLLEGMKHSHVKQSRFFLVDSLRFLCALRTSRELRHMLSQKLDEMQTFGIISSSESMNPVHNLMKLIATSVLGKYISFQALPILDISNMLDDISNGDFNLLQRGGRPTALQLETYATTSQALRHELSMFSMVQGKNRHH